MHDMGNFFVSYYLSLTTSLFGLIKNKAKPLVEAKYHGMKLTPIQLSVYLWQYMETETDNSCNDSLTLQDYMEKAQYTHKQLQFFLRS